VSAVTQDRRTLRLLTLIDECRGSTWRSAQARRLGSQEVIATLAEVTLVRGIPEYLTSDNVLT
jgi:hypothetical protein